MCQFNWDLVIARAFKWEETGLFILPDRQGRFSAFLQGSESGTGEPFRDRPLPCSWARTPAACLFLLLSALWPQRTTVVAWVHQASGSRSGTYSGVGEPLFLLPKAALCLSDGVGRTLALCSGPCSEHPGVCPREQLLGCHMALHRLEF